MNGSAIDALQAERTALLDVCGGLTDAEWKAESGCAGWSVQDVVAHMGTQYWLVVDPSALPDATGLPTEQAQEITVDSRRSWSADRVMDDYESVSLKAIKALARLEGKDFELPLGDLGTYPASLVANAFAFDHYTHIRADLFSPRGPLTGTPPPSDSLRLEPALDWIAAAVGQQNSELIASLPGTVSLVVTGVAARTVPIGHGEPVAQVKSDAPAFIRWVTQRGTWEDLGVVATGDEAALATVMGLHVF